MPWSTLVSVYFMTQHLLADRGTYWIPILRYGRFMAPQTYNKVLSYTELYKSFSVCISDVIFLWYLKVFSMPIYYSYKSVINFLLSCNENPGGLKKWHAKKKLFSAFSQNKHFEFWFKNIYGITFIFPVNRSVRQLTKSNFLNSTENTFVVPQEFLFQISTTFFN